MTEEQIERAARLMCAANGKDPDLIVHGPPDVYPREQAKAAWTLYRHHIVTAYQATEAINQVLAEDLASAFGLPISPKSSPSPAAGQ